MKMVYNRMATLVKTNKKITSFWKSLGIDFSRKRFGQNQETSW